MSVNDSLVFYGRHFTERLLICEVAMETFIAVVHGQSYPQGAGVG